MNRPGSRNRKNKKKIRGALAGAGIVALFLALMISFGKTAPENPMDRNRADASRMYLLSSTLDMDIDQLANIGNANINAGDSANQAEQEEQQQAPPPEVPKAEEIIEIVENDAKVEETVIQASDDTEKAVEVKYTPVVVEEEEPEEQQIFQIVEEMPEFPGGMGECLKFLMKNAKYPTISQENGVQGKVSVKFVIEKDGSIADPVVVRGVDPYLDKEALRVVKSMPKWKPGKQRGKPVRVSYTVPVIFKLQ